MNTPRVKTKVEELLDKLQNLSEADRNNLFLLNSLQREAEKLKTAHAYGAYIALGVVSALKGDIQKMHDYHKAAITIAPVGDLNAAYNYAVSLYYLDYFSEAAHWATTVFKGSVNLNHYKLALQTLRDACRFSDAASLIRETDEQLNNLVKLNTDAVLEVADYLASNEISDEQTESIQKIAVALIKERDAEISTVRIGMLNDEDSSWASVIWEIESDQKIRGLNSKLSERISESEVPARVLGVFNICLRQAAGKGDGNNKQGIAGVLSEVRQ